MMILIFAAFVVVCLIGVKFRPAEGAKYMTDYMSVDKTMSVKGFFIIVVFFSHFNSYVTFTSVGDQMYMDAFRTVGQCMVTMFLFYSGYGVTESVKKKGASYIHKIPLTRILGTYFRVAFALILFIIMWLVFGRTFPIGRILLSITGWETLGNSNWYIFAVVMAYLITFISFETGNLFSKKLSPGVCNFISAVLVTVLCCVYIHLFRFNDWQPKHWYDTMICYVFGTWYSLLHDKIERIINCHTVVYLLFLIGTYAGMNYFAERRKEDFELYEMYIVFFMLFVLVLTMRVSVHNKVLMWCGKNLFGLYILQRIPMIVLKEVGLASYNKYLFFFASLAITVPLAWLFEKYTGKLWGLITSPKRKQEKKTA